MRSLLYPVLRFVLPFFSLSSRMRLDFELKELLENPSVQSATYSFEVSSEGELEQVYSIVLSLLLDQQFVEIIYCSPSVEHKCQALQKQYPDQLRLLRLPILRFNPSGHKTNSKHWLTGKYLFLCRYDFFPELLSYGRKKGVKLILLSGMVVTFKDKNFLVKWYLRNCYLSFDKIIAATELDKKIFINDLKIPSHKIDVFDFREVQIRKRQDKAFDTILAKIGSFTLLRDYLDTQEQKLIFGSLWDHELSIFDSLNTTNKHIAIAPHKLDREHLDVIVDYFDKNNIPIYPVTVDTTDDQMRLMIQEAEQGPGIWLFNVKGILCELFTFYDTAYIGGGFGESIHSVLEPYFAGCHIVCGPKTDRSSEYRYIHSKYSEKIDRKGSLNEVTMTLDQSHYKNQTIISDDIHGQSFNKVLKWLIEEI